MFYEDTGEVEFRANGEMIATFADQEDVFADASAYPATEPFDSTSSAATVLEW